MKKSIIAMLILLAGIQSGFSASVPREVAADHRVKVVQYDVNNVVVLHGRYGYQTQITFAPNETIQGVSIGDSMAWLAVPVQNHLFIKPVAESKTNMTVLTNIRSYNFQLDSDIRVAPTYQLQFTYADGGYEMAGASNSAGSFDPAKMNWKYSFTGDKTNVPNAAFDNGQFTYFKFNPNGKSHQPAVFVVDKNRNETLVNYHMQGDYMIINTVVKQFTLRDGESVTNVYNDLAIGDWESVK